MRHRHLTGALVTALAVLTAVPRASPAQATYNFTFSGTTGTVAGSFLLPFLTPGGSGMGSASLVTLTSYPGLAIPEGNTASSWAYQGINTFTVVGGVITSYGFNAATDNGADLCFNSGPDSFLTIGGGVIRVCRMNLNYLSTDGDQPSVTFNRNGPAGITFTAGAPTPVPPVTSTPEPSTWSMFAGGLLCVGAAARGRRRGT